MPRSSFAPTSILWLALLAGACDDSPGAADAPELALDGLVAAPRHDRSVAGAPGQITVYDEDQRDPLDPTVLHVPVPAGQEAVALARAVDLRSVSDRATRPEPEMAAVLASQQIAAELVYADAVATADVTAVTPVLAPDGSSTDLLDVVFSVDTLLRGTSPGSWTSRLPLASSCGPVAPAVGDQRLVFVDVGTTSAQLRIGAPFVPVVSGHVDLLGLGLSVADLANVIQQNPETT